MMEAQTKSEFDVSDQIVAFKRKMKPRHDVLKRAYDDVRGYVMKAADKIRTDNAAGRSTIPELNYRDIKDGKISDATKKAIRLSGCAIVRGVFPASQADRLVQRRRPLSRGERVREEGSREAFARQIFLAAQGGQAADLQRLLVEAAGAGAPGRKARRDALVP